MTLPSRITWRNFSMYVLLTTEFGLLKCENFCYHHFKRWLHTAMRQFPLYPIMTTNNLRLSIIIAWSITSKDVYPTPRHPNPPGYHNHEAVKALHGLYVPYLWTISSSAITTTKPFPEGHLISNLLTPHCHLFGTTSLSKSQASPFNDYRHSFTLLHSQRRVIDKSVM